MCRMGARGGRLDIIERGEVPRARRPSGVVVSTSELKNAASERRSRKLRRVRAKRGPVGVSGCSEEAEEEEVEVGARWARGYLLSSWGYGDRVLRIRSALPCQTSIHHPRRSRAKALVNPLRQRIPLILCPRHLIHSKTAIIIWTAVSRVAASYLLKDTDSMSYIHTPALCLTFSDGSHDRTSPFY